MFLVDWPGGSWEATLRVALTILALYLAVMWVALVFWAYRDVRQRTRDPIVQTVSVLLVLVFFLPGHWIYLILRPRYTLNELYERSLEEETLLQDLEDQKACPNCRRRVHDDFLVCPSCRTSLKEPCPNCQRPLNHAWVACPYCAIERAPRPAPVQRVPRPRAPGEAPRRPPEPARAPGPPPARRPAPAPSAGTERAAARGDASPVIDATAD